MFLDATEKKKTFSNDQIDGGVAGKVVDDVPLKSSSVVNKESDFSPTGTATKKALKLPWQNDEITEDSESDVSKLEYNYVSFCCDCLN